MVNYDAVAEAAAALQIAGKKVTILSVRERIGRGSFTTVKKFLEQWRQVRHTAAHPTSALPPQLESLWDEARKAALADLTAERQSVEQLAADLQARFEALQAQTLEAERRRQEAEVRLADKAAEIMRTAGQIEGLQALLAQTQAHLKCVLDQAAQARAATEQRQVAMADHLEPFDGSFTRHLESAAKEWPQSGREWSELVLRRVDAKFEAQSNHFSMLREAVVLECKSVAAIAAKLDELQRCVRQVRRLQHASQSDRRRKPLQSIS